MGKRVIDGGNQDMGGSLKAGTIRSDANKVMSGGSGFSY